jgi:hypothetical protein
MKSIGAELLELTGSNGMVWAVWPFPECAVQNA